MVNNQSHYYNHVFCKRLNAFTKIADVGVEIQLKKKLFMVVFMWRAFYRHKMWFLRTEVDRWTFEGLQYWCASSWKHFTSAWGDCSSSTLQTAKNGKPLPVLRLCSHYWRIIAFRADTKSWGHYTFLELPTYPSPKPTFCPKWEVTE